MVIYDFINPVDKARLCNPEGFMNIQPHLPVILKFFISVKQILRTDKHTDTGQIYNILCGNDYPINAHAC